jgi:uncharacterized protein
MKSPKQSYSWMHSALEVRDTGKYGLGVFATHALQQETLLIACGGPILTIEDENHLPGECADLFIEISECHSFGPRTAEEIPLMPQHYVNHSCNPNAGWKGQIFLMAMRDIQAGEEITYDYAMVMHSNPQSTSYWTMRCLCGSALCRREIAEDDWMLPELQARCDGWFNWHHQNKVDALKLKNTGWGCLKIGSGRRYGWHWVDDRLQPKNSQKGGDGLFAVSPIPRHTLAYVQGGRVTPVAKEESDESLQITEDLVIGPLASEIDFSDKINHSCDPNLGIIGQIFLVTLRGIQVDEELCFDYAMCLSPASSVPPYRMECRCGSPRCRGIIKDTDWQIQELRTNYRGWFSWHLAKGIEILRDGQSDFCSYA